MIIIIIFCICITGLILSVIMMAKQSKDILYIDGRSFVSFDLTFAWKNDFLNRRVKRLSEEAKGKVRKWIYLDFAFMPCFYLSVAIACWWTSTVFKTGFFYYSLQVLTIGQGISWICDIYENLTILRVLKNPDARINMFIYDVAVSVKFLFPTLAVILFVAAIILKWSRFLYMMVNNSAVVFFLLPALLICLVVAVSAFLKKKQDTKATD